MPNPAYKVGDAVLVRLPEGEVVVARVLGVNTGLPNVYLLSYTRGEVFAMLPESDIIRLLN
ncbi:MAG TPA: hypothetical protein VMW83_10215 [Spirochaetia bacterium]|nr:hypothetical protein [Spirochaetia bacterium]